MGINIVSGDIDNIANKNRYDVIAYLDENDTLWKSPENENDLIKHNLAKLVFWVCRSDASVECIENTFKNYSYVRLYNYSTKDGQRYNLFAFYADKIQK